MSNPHARIQTKSGLTPLQENFCHEYLVDLDPGAAYERAGYKTHASYRRQHGLNLLKNHRIELRIHELMDLRGRMTDVTAERVVQELSRIAFSDLRELVSWGPTGAKSKDSEELTSGVRWKDSEELTDEAAAVVKEIYETEREMDDGGVYRTKRIQMHDKMAALKELAKHTGVGQADKGLNVTVNVEAEQKNQKDMATLFSDIDNWRAEQEKALPEERVEEDAHAPHNL